MKARLPQSQGPFRGTFQGFWNRAMYEDELLDFCNFWHMFPALNTKTWGHTSRAGNPEEMVKVHAVVLGSILTHIRRKDDKCIYKCRLQPHSPYTIIYIHISHYRHINNNAGRWAKFLADQRTWLWWKCGSCLKNTKHLAVAFLGDRIRIMIGKIM